MLLSGCCVKDGVQAMGAGYSGPGRPLNSLMSWKGIPMGAAAVGTTRAPWVIWGHFSALTVFLRKLACEFCDPG